MPAIAALPPLALVMLSGGIGAGLRYWAGLRLLLGVGGLGGFTSFSAFSLDAVETIVRGEVGLTAAYAVSSVADSMLALFVGLFVVPA